MKYSEVSWGPVLVKFGPFKGRIGELDDEDDGLGIVYFGTLQKYHTSANIPFRSLKHVTTDDLMRRSEEIAGKICTGCPPIDVEDELDLLYEYHYISNVLQDRWMTAQKQRIGDFGVFLSHSSLDKQTVRWIAVDLGNHGYRPWLDEWEITAGESIPRRISEGLEECAVVVVALSPKSVNSYWVEKEWQAKYFDEIERNHVTVIPILLDHCKIPTLLRSKRYANFAESFSDGMDDLHSALQRIRLKRTEQDAAANP
jgi:hypothetical protein